MLIAPVFCIVGRHQPLAAAAPSLLLPFTLTAGSLSVVTGYHPGFGVGSISREPIAASTLSLFYSRSDDGTTTIQFTGDQTALLAGHHPIIGGVPMVLDTDWFYDGTPGIDATAAGSNTPYFTTEGDYAITWS
jgi:hypothetical protein